MTAVTLAEGVEHPILTDVNAFQAYSWLYHVDGGDWELQGDAAPLLIGRSLRSKHEMDGRLDEFPLVNPVAWTKSYTGESGKTSRVFFTTLGHPYDFRNPNMRRRTDLSEPLRRFGGWRLTTLDVRPRRGCLQRRAEAKNL